MELESYIHLIAGKPCLGIYLPKGSFASYSSYDFSISSPFKALLLFTCLLFVKIAPNVAEVIVQAVGALCLLCQGSWVMDNGVQDRRGCL